MLSFGAAFLGAPPADGYRAPDEDVPGAVCSTIAQQQCWYQPNVLLGLFRSCRGGRDLVLAWAPKARLSLALPPTGPVDKVARRLQHISDALAKRGERLPTHLQLVAQHQQPPDSSEQEAVLSLLESTLTARAACITQLTIGHTQPGQGMQAAARALSCLTALRSLSIIQGACVLPPQLSQLSQLTYCHIQIPTGFDAEAKRDMYNSIGRSLPQLIALRVTEDSHYRLHEVQPRWSYIFTAQSTSHTLTHFSTYNTLSDELLSLLVNHAPALTHLSVGTMLLTADTCRQRQWRVKELHAGDKALHGAGYLPVPAAGPVQCKEWIEMPGEVSSV